MRDIMTQVVRVTDLISEISSATKEQSDGIGQVNVAVSQLDQMTQQTAALVQRSAGTAADLEARTSLLVDAVHVFRSDMGVSTSTAPTTVR